MNRDLCKLKLYRFKCSKEFFLKPDVLIRRNKEMTKPADILVGIYEFPKDITVTFNRRDKFIGSNYCYYYSDDPKFIEPDDNTLRELIKNYEIFCDDGIIYILNDYKIIEEERYGDVA